MTDLITLAEYKAHTTIPSTNTSNDVQITNFISAVSSLFEKYCNTKFTDYFTTPIVEDYDVYYPSHVLQLNYFPLKEIISVEERGLADTNYVELTDFRLDASTDSLIKIIDGRHQDWNYGPRSVRVTYTFGYSSVPSDVKLAAVNMVDYYLKAEYKTAQSIGSNSMSGVPVFSTSKPEDLPGHIKRVLDLYKNV